MTELWLRNPEFYVREAREVGVTNFIWDMGYLVNHKMDPDRFMELWMQGFRWRSLVIDNKIARELTSEGHVQEHDVWKYGTQIEGLEKLLTKNAGTSRMTIITDIPDVGVRVVGSFMQTLSHMQDDYPESKIHIHGIYSFAFLFGLNWQSVDFEPRIAAQGGKIHLPNGRNLKWDDTPRQKEWVHLLGMRPIDLRRPRNRCIYNIRSAEWAASYYKETPRFATKYKPRMPGQPQKRPRRIYFHRIDPEDGDKVLCDSCSLAADCRLFRQGAICAVPGSEVADLATHFGTRDAVHVVEGLGELLSTQMERLQKGMDAEADPAEDQKFELDPAVTRLFDVVFRSGERLAKLLDPKLSRPSVQVGIVQASAGAVEAGPQMSSQQLVGQIVAELEASGVARKDITPEMIERVMKERAQQAAGAIGTGGD